ncbi:MAG TPA: hypothetical protein VEX18_00610 [Polyangiaceae bacterium]|nr:hypothetical protein [Polyangiaceae bacterium]
MNEQSRPRLAPGLAAGLALSLPVALRAAWDVERPLPAAVLAMAAASLVVVPVGLWIRHGRWRDLASMDRALVDGAALSSLPLALFAGVLKSTTHHRPLGGATFAVGACVAIAFCIALAHRVGSSGAKAHWLKHFFSVCCWLSLVVTVAFAASGTGILADLIPLAVACLCAGLLKIPLALSRVGRARGVAKVAPLAAWALLLMVGVALTRQQELVQALRVRAPISFAALSWLGDGS